MKIFLNENILFHFSYIDSAASFIVERRAGIEGSGMLRLSSKPSKYMCVRKEKYIDSALQAIEKQETDDFKYRCSFFLQKLRGENIDSAINKSIAEGGKKKSSITTPTSSSTSTKSASPTANVVTPKRGATIDGLLAAFNKKLEFHQHTLQIEAAVAMEKRKKAKAAQEDLAAKKAKINSKGTASKKGKLTQQQHQAAAQQNHQASLAEISLSKTNVPSSLAQTRNPPSTPYILYQQQNSEANQMPNMVMGVRGNLYYNNNNNQVMNPISYTRQSQQNNKYKAMVAQSKVRPSSTNKINKKLIGGQKQAKNNPKAALSVHKGETRLIGPKTPVNLHDFPTTHNHREPALNLDGLVHSVKLPATRSKIATVSSNDTKTRDMSNGTSAKLHDSPVNEPQGLMNNGSTSKATENVFFHIENNGTHVERVQLDDGHDKNKTAIAEKIDEDGGKNSTNLTANSTSTSASATKNSTSTPEDLSKATASLANNNTAVLLLSNKTEAAATANATKYERNSTLKADQLNATKIGEIKVSSNNATALKTDQMNTTIFQNVSAPTNLVNNTSNKTTSNENASNSTTADDKKKLNATENASLTNSTKTLDQGLPHQNTSSTNKMLNDSSLQLVNSTAANLPTANNNTVSLNKNQTSSNPEKNTTAAAQNHLELHPQNSTVTNATSRDSIFDHKPHQSKLLANESSTIRPKGFLSTSSSSPSASNTTFDLMPDDSASNSKDVAAGKKSHGTKTDEPDRRNSTSSEEEQESDSRQVQDDSNNKKNTTTTSAESATEEENRNRTLTDAAEEKKNTSTVNLDSSTFDAKLNNQSSADNTTEGSLSNSTTASAAEQTSPSNQNKTTSGEVGALAKNTASSSSLENTKSSSLNQTVSAIGDHSSEEMKNTTSSATASLANTTEHVTQNQTTSKLNQTHQGKDQLLVNPRQRQLLAMMQRHQGRFPSMEPMNRQRMMMMNSSISYGGNGVGASAADGLARDVSAAYANNTGGFDSPDEQNAMLMQSVQGAVRKINEDDVRMVSQKMRALEKEDRTTAPSMERILAGDGNPHVQNLLLGGYGVNQTMGFANDTGGGAGAPVGYGGPGIMEGDEAYSRSGMEMNPQQQPQYLANNTLEEENGDSRSHLYKPKKGFMMPAVNRDQVSGDGHHVLENHDLRNDFHQKADELSHTDKERYNELQHVESGSELHHYHNDDAMHPPTLQHSVEINDLHHLNHGYVNDDTMTPPEHRLPQDYYNDWIHHGQPHDYPANQDAAHIKHIATDHVTDGKLCFV